MNKNILLSALLLLLIPMVSEAKIWTVEVANYQFSPSALNVTVGDTVRWVWKSGSHTTTSTGVPAGAQTWDSPINSGSGPYDYVIQVAGNYSYWCIPHAPDMAGTITASGSLPVVFLGFSVSPGPGNSSAKLNWSTASEENITGFTLKKSTDGKTFEEFATVPSAGNSSQPRSYTEMDYNIAGFTYIYYMIEVVEKDGTVSRSDIQKFRNPGIAQKLITSISPNPVSQSGHLMLQFTADKSSVMLVQIFDASGKLVKEVTMQAYAGINDGHLHLGGISPGVYRIVFRLDDLKETHTIVFQ